MTRTEPYHATMVLDAVRSASSAAISPVAASWCRSALHHGLDPESSVERERIDATALALLREKLEPLLAVAAPVLDQTFRSVGRSGCGVILSDARGAPLVLDGRELRTGERAFDLATPLEWRSIVFQEGLGQAIAVYQGTWIRQAATEIVLVSLLPSIVSAGAQGIAEGGSLAGLDRSVLRDLRLMQAVPEEPPPVEQRVAIDRLFMLPVRYALDKAPRPTKHPLGRAQRQG